MFSSEVLSKALARVEATVGFPLPYTIAAERCAPGEGLTVTLEGNRARILAGDEAALTRSLFLLARCVREGRDALHVHQERRFASCGVMADVSRGAVLTPEAARRLIDQLASLGMNLLMLYTEDTYAVPEYPLQGYLRGRYSQDELRALDAYAADAGVELVPCIQTLGHMEQLLQWDASAELRDQRDILMIDDERTYALIDAQLRALRGCVRTSRIHIGMDEAHGVGLGRYLLEHGMTDRFELLSRHLRRVIELCECYGFRPIMWSDMFFRLGSRTNDYYDEQAVIPQEVIDHLPPVDLCYWDYYHDSEAFYDRMIAQHERMGRETVFAGGVWTWAGFLPQVQLTEATMRPALRVCARRRVRTVLATMWGDDGAETNLFLGSSLLPMFSEACWQGEDCPQEEIDLAGECLTGLPREALHAMGLFFPGPYEKPLTGKALIWCDPLYPLCVGDRDTPQAAAGRAQQALDVLSRHAGREDCRYAALLFEIVIQKAHLLAHLREDYLCGDRDALRAASDEHIPRLLTLYDQLMRAHRALWERDMKRFGWEVLALRYGAVTGRLADAQDELRRYLAGEIPSIPELEEEPLCATRGVQTFANLATPSAHL